MALPVSDRVLASRYRLEGLVASGGMGEVWRAVDLVLQRPVAVKLLRPEYAQHPETLARFRAEARHAAALSHPAIAQIYDYGEADTRRAPFLVMELVDGPSLTGLLTAGPLEPARVADLVAQVAGGLAAAHAAGVLHRDIKPGNLLIDRSGRVKITDFGISYAAGSAPLTRTGQVIGTPGYLAPERLAGAGAGPAGDLYSLGMVAYESLTGRLPFTGTAVEIALAHQHQPLPPLPPSVPKEVAVLVADLTARDPAMRPASAADVAARAAALRDGLAGTTINMRGADPLTRSAGQGDTAYLSVPAEPDPWLSEAAQHRPRRRGPGPLALAAAVAAIVIIGLGGWVLAGSPGSAAHGPAAGSSNPPGHLVTVQASALIGQPARLVERQLRALGLHVSVTKQPDPHHNPGTVLGVSPHGRLRTGTTIVITVASMPGHGNDHGNGNGNGHGGDNGQGGGD